MTNVFAGQGAGLEAEAPDLFEVQDEGSLVVLDEESTGGQRAITAAACEACPTEALTVVD